MAETIRYIPGWNGGARSTAVLRGNGYYTFSVVGTSVAVGLSKTVCEGAWTQIEHAFRVSGSLVDVYESGARRTSPSVSQTPGVTVFKIERTNGRVRYYLGNTLIYTSAVASTGAVWIDAALYKMGDEVIDIEMVDEVIADVTALPGTFTIDETTGALIDDETGEPIESDLGESLTYAGAGFRYAAVGGDADGLGAGAWRYASTATGYDYDSSSSGFAYASSAGDADGLGDGSFRYTLTGHDLVADSALCYGEGFFAYGSDTYTYTDFPAEGESAWAYDAAAADVEGALGFGQWGMESSGNVGDTYPAVFVLELDSPLAMGQDANYILFDWPAFTGEAFVSTGDNNALFLWPAFTGEAFTGARATFDWPALEGEAEVTNPNFATAEFDWPGFEGEATVFTGQVASATFNWPAFQGEAFSGASASFAWPTFEGDATVTVGSVMSALFDWPAFAGEAVVTSQGVMSALFDWPAFEGEAGDGTYALFDWPAFAGSATVTHAVVTADAEAYAINLATGAMTRLLLGPLDKLVTAHGKLYALRDGELLVLAGDVDGVDTAIPATARFAQQRFGVFNAKRCSKVYLDTREDDGITLDLIEDERTAWRYQTPTDTAPAMGTHKVSTGRGIKFHTLGVVVKNRAGGRLDIGGIELLVEPLSRRPKT
jgi:hypothetical protein